MFNSKYSTFLTVLLIIAIIAIIGLLGYFGYTMFSRFSINNENEEAIASINYNTENNTGNNNNNTIDIEDVESVDTSGQNSEKPNTFYGYNMAGYIEIPKINIKYVVLDKVTKKSIQVAVAILDGPGLNQIGNTLIIGHNYRNGTFFSNLKKLSNGDAIYITDLSGTKIKYIVYSVYDTDPQDVSYMTRDTEGKREISLYTCTDDGKERTTVLAREE